MTRYFVSIRDGGKDGPTIWADDNVRADSLQAARDYAEREFTVPKDIALTGDAQIDNFLQRTEARRARVMQTGYYINAHKSKAK